MLVERESLLASLAAALDEALAGHGSLVLVGGEAGVGKTQLVRASAETAASRCRIRQGAVDNVTTADALAAFQDAVPEASALVSDGASAAVLFRAIRDVLAREPTLVILEDLHWADEATLDALRFLARRLDGVPALIVGTYRDDEISARHPLTQLLGDVATAAQTRRLTVPTLSVGGVAELVKRAGASMDPAELHGRTGGNAFYVSELLAGGSTSLPATVSDAVLARYASLSPAAQDCAAAAAVMGTATTPELVASVAGRGLEPVDECLEAGVLLRGVQGIGFRHVLAREAIERSLSLLRARQLHGRALRALERTAPEDHRRIAHHAAGAGDAETAAHHAIAAAHRAAQLGAHREAATQFRAALRHGVTGAARAEVFVALSYECYLTDQLQEALTARQHALELHELRHDQAALGEDERWLSRLSWFLGRGSDADRHATRAIETLEPLGPSAALAMAYSNLAQLRMLAMRPAETAEWGNRALALATDLGLVEIQAHALNNLGASQAQAGRFEVGRAQLQRSLDIARAEDLEEHAARAFTNLGSVAAEQRRLDLALRDLEAGIRYCDERDLDSWTRYMQAWRCVVLSDLGRFAEALACAQELLDHPGIAPVSAIPASAAAARASARRGEDPGRFLDLSVSLAAGTGELQRIGAAACAAAECAWLHGALDRIVPSTDAAWELAIEHQDPWMLGELSWWRSLAGVTPDAGFTLAPPFEAMAQGTWGDALRRWDELGVPVWSAYAAVLDPREETAAHAVRTLDAMGAERAVEALLRTRRERDLPLPRRPRADARGRPGQLTAREHEILGLLARGLSTPEIAQLLVVSPRTVEHHVSAVLRKLEVPTRARAIAAARTSGLLSD